ncbi:hypothetical protein IGI04_025948, partial [Brassica rapa subsp. trilocularis]
KTGRLSEKSSLKDTHKVNCETNICIDQKTYTTSVLTRKSSDRQIRNFFNFIALTSEITCLAYPTTQNFTTKATHLCIKSFKLVVCGGWYFDGNDNIENTC